MRIVISGAGSFLGRALAEHLGARADRPELCLLRHSFEEAEPGVLPEHADAWVHFAWAGVGSDGRSDPAIQEQNIEMSMAALAKAAELGCTRFLFAGSQAEYGKARLRGGLQCEDALCMPQSAYGKAKLSFGQRAARWVADWNEDDTPQRMRLIHMRIFSVYGPGDHENSLIRSAIRCFREGKDLALGPCTQDWDYLYVGEAARAIACLIEAEEAEGIYNIASGEIRPLRAYLEQLHTLMRSESRMRFGARGDNAEGAVSLRPSLAKLQEATGFRNEISFAEGIRRTIEAES